MSNTATQITDNESPTAPVDFLADYTPVAEVARQINKHTATVLRMLPRDLILHVGRTPYAHTARTREFLLAGGKQSAPRSAQPASQPRRKTQSAAEIRNPPPPWEAR